MDSSQNTASVTGGSGGNGIVVPQSNETAASTATSDDPKQNLNQLDNMTKLSEKCNIQVPMEVLNLIDDGKNPDEFTRDVINSCIAKNQITKGKTDAFKESKRLAQTQSMLPNGDVKVKTEL
ncbi:hypothetical protein L1049_022409 [Liquidambar formosana]|uniref:Mediator of RNA polymerase II transcription subunit 10 n=1 Tax=Liquidambar formosana TaxID=63359 RepID=A0AAP0RDW2_LIQFO